MKLDMRLFKHQNGTFYIEYRRGKAQSLRTKVKTEAMPLYNKARRQWLQGKVSDILGECSVTLAEFLAEVVVWTERNRSKATYRINRIVCRDMLNVIDGRTKLDRISLKELDALVEAYRGRNLKPGAVNVYIRHARAIMGKSVDWDYLKANPFSRARQVPDHKGPPRFIGPEDIPRFLMSIQDVDVRRLATAYLSTGMRRGELLNLMWEDVDMTSERVLVRHQKTHLIKWKPINAQFMAVLQAIGPKEKGRIFQRWKHPDTLSKIIKSALRDAGMGILTLNSLRHTFASYLLMKGQTIQVVQELLGHTDPRTTAIYAHLTQGHLRKASEVQFGPVDLGGK